MLSFSLLLKLLVSAIIASLIVSAVPYPDQDDVPYLGRYLNKYGDVLSYQTRVRKAGHLSNMMRIGRSDRQMLSRGTRQTNANNVNSLRGRIWLLP